MPAIVVNSIHCCSCGTVLDMVFYMPWNPDELGFSDLTRGISSSRMCKQCITSFTTTDFLAVEVRIDDATGALFPHAIRTIVGAEHVKLEEPTVADTE